MYLIAIIPYLMYIVSLVSKYMENPTKLHFFIAKRIFCYLKGIAIFGLLHKKENKSGVIGFNNNDFT